MFYTPAVSLSLRTRMKNDHVSKLLQNEYLDELLNCACVHVCLPLDGVVFLLCTFTSVPLWKEMENVKIWFMALWIPQCRNRPTEGKLDASREPSFGSKARQ